MFKNENTLIKFKFQFSRAKVNVKVAVLRKYVVSSPMLSFMD